MDWDVFQKKLIPLQKSLQKAIPLSLFDAAFQDKLKRLSDFEHDVCNRDVKDFKEDSEYRSSHRKMCEKLGENGWVVSGTCTPNTLSEWTVEIDTNGEESIEAYFAAESLQSIIENIRERLAGETYLYYWEQGITHFRNADYNASAMFLLALIDRIFSLVKTPYFLDSSGNIVHDKNGRIKRLSSGQLYNYAGMEILIDTVHKNTKNKPLNRSFTLIEYIPSLVMFLHRVFFDGKYTFEQEIEPPYLNRNWLMHGRMTRNVERYECVQLINAIDTLLSIKRLFDNVD